jgi:hypothetical protein
LAVFWRVNRLGLAASPSDLLHARDSIHQLGFRLVQFAPLNPGDEINSELRISSYNESLELDVTKDISLGANFRFYFAESIDSTLNLPRDFLGFTGKTRTDIGAGLGRKNTNPFRIPLPSNEFSCTTNYNFSGHRAWNMPRHADGNKNT